MCRYSIDDGERAPLGPDRHLNSTRSVCYSPPRTRQKYPCGCPPGVPSPRSMTLSPPSTQRPWNQSVLPLAAVVPCAKTSKRTPESVHPKPRFPRTKVSRGAPCESSRSNGSPFPPPVESRGARLRYDRQAVPTEASPSTLPRPTEESTRKRIAVRVVSTDRVPSVEIMLNVNTPARSSTASPVGNSGGEGTVPDLLPLGPSTQVQCHQSGSVGVGSTHGPSPFQEAIGLGDGGREGMQPPRTPPKASPDTMTALN